MGSRITVSLADLLSLPRIGVTLVANQPTDVEINSDVPVSTTAEITDYDTSLVYHFDYHLYEGKVELSADFNWFRYPNDPEHHSRRLLKLLYTHSVSFTVHH